MTEKNEKSTLASEDIATERGMGRRSALQLVSGTMLGGLLGGLVTAAPERAQAQGCSDNDSGQYADPGGQGRRCGGGGGSGCSDSDTGQYSDPAGRGRSCGRTR